MCDVPSFIFKVATCKCWLIMQSVWFRACYVRIRRSKNHCSGINRASLPARDSADPFLFLRSVFLRSVNSRFLSRSHKRMALSGAISHVFCQSHRHVAVMSSTRYVTTREHVDTILVCYANQSGTIRWLKWREQQYATRLAQTISAEP